MSASGQTDDPSGSTEEPEGHHAAVSQQADAETVMGVQPQGADVPRTDEEYIESKTTPGIRCENKIKGHKIKEHNLLHYPTKPWYDIWIQSRNRDDFRQRAGRDSKTDEHLIGTPNGMVRCRALKRRVERRRWDIDLLNAMIWDPWSPIPVTKGKPLKVYSDREPFLTRTISRVPHQEMMLGTTATQSSTERVRIRSSETEADGALLAQRTKTTTSAMITRAETTFQTTAISLARIPFKQFGNEAGKDSQLTQIRRIAAFTTECEEL